MAQYFITLPNNRQGNVKTGVRKKRSSGYARRTADKSAWSWKLKAGQVQNGYAIVSP